MTAGTSPHALRTTASVLDCAARLFAEHGSRGLATSALIRRVSAETGTDAASLRRAFPTWFDLAYAVVLRSTRERVDGQLAADQPGLPAAERMSSLVRRHVEIGWKHRAATSLAHEILPVLRAVHPDRHREVGSLTRTYREHVRGIIVDGLVAGAFGVDEPGRAADEVLATFDSLLHWYEPEAGLSLDDLGAVYVDLVLHHHLGHPR
ncbi:MULTISPECIES: TetR/AcrR family transcriptional regulator [Nocardiopsis]|uniref:TetR family transcriptional regulator n=1 Tax=Nocardiopsis sinuspersici TaxID=501010 RepID=A0A1V3BXC8_9ACTN|nr:MULTISPECIES: TetR/AcrR family transcriptional regulator [Nocardiopsis]OOC53063.1 TetR family transcriptional regulator [Nocardiopsis sinuspersici]